ncbi:MAG TPA: hypothetical protein VH599_14245 [Ktedonobacterales bacterium]
MRNRAFSFFLALSLLVFAACDISTGPGGNAPTGPIASANITPDDPSFHGCPGTGDGGDTILNTFKNRTDEGNYVSVSLADLLALTWPQDTERVSHGNWSDSERAEIAKYEGAPVETTGYLLDYKHEGTESTNCHASDYRDYHMWLAVNASDSRAESIVIEITPRMQAQRPGWVDALKDLKGQHVRISGWLLFDQEHPEQLGKTRKTLWEIHPIMHIDLDQGGGNWVSVDN